MKQKAKMKEIDINYFSQVRKKVNTAQYNHHVLCNYHEVTHVDNLLDENLINQMNITLMHHGFIVIQMNEAQRLNIDNIEQWLRKIFGAPFIKKNPGKVHYAKVQYEKNAKFYINSCLAQPIHTDEGHTITYPSQIALYCIKPALIGGDSILVSLKPLYQKLVENFGDLVNDLFARNAITVQNVYGIEKKPILIRLKNNDIGISYSPVVQRIWCLEHVFQMYDFITSYVHHYQNQLRLKLSAGQMVLIDNCRILHGRTLFPENADRLLYRYWFGNNVL